jgi:multidrug efflux system outer membrane protein
MRILHLQSRDGGVESRKPKAESRREIRAGHDEGNVAPRLHRSRRVKRFCYRLLLLALLANTACAAPGTMLRSTLPLPEGFSASGGTTLPDRWWLAFDDPVLADLVERALEHNPGLLATWARLDQADAAARGAGASRYPSVDASVGAGASVRQGGNPNLSVSLGLSASYEVDLWGRVDATVDAATLEAQASEMDLRAAAITLSAQIATTWYQLVTRYAEQELLLQQVELAERVLDLTRQRYESGLITVVDVLSQEQNLESLRADVTATAAAAALLEHSLAVLLGRPPLEIVAPRTTELVTLPPLPAAGVPSELMERRPDLVATYLRVQAADRNVAAAITAQYPRLSLSASLSEALTISTQTLVGWAVSLVGNLVAPLFDGGKLEAAAEQARARLSEAVQGYAQTMLAALAEIEDALTGEQAGQAALESLDRQLAFATEVLARVEEAYTAGLSDYLKVLDAMRSLQSLQRQRLQLQNALLQTRIALCRALAGSWTLERPEDAR